MSAPVSNGVVELPVNGISHGSNKINVLKFGGTSVGKFAHAIVNVVKSSLANCPVAIVCSARSSSTKLAGTTNRLLRAAAEAELHRSQEYRQLIEDVRQDHLETADSHIKSPELREQLKREIDVECNYVLRILEAAETLGESSPRSRDKVVSVGEKLSCRFMTVLLQDEGVEAEYVDFARVIDFPAAADLDKNFYEQLARSMGKRLKGIEGKVAVITGFFGALQQGLLGSVGRGYTDLCAALVAVGLEAQELQIWKEVDGIFTADPRKVPTARLIPQISPAEAAELSFYGSEVIHPATMEQVIRARIPIRIKNVMNPRGAGTIIYPDLPAEQPQGSPRHDAALFRPRSASGLRPGQKPKRPTAVTLKNKILVMNISSNKRSLAHGFFAGIFSTLDKWRLSVDLISTSEVNISMALHSEAPMWTGGGADDYEIVDQDLRGAIEELQSFGTIDIKPDMAIVSLVGKDMKNMVGVAGKMFSTLGENNINLEIISQGASEINISCVIEERHASRALNSLHTNLFTFLDQLRASAERSSGGGGQDQANREMTFAAGRSSLAIVGRLVALLMFLLSAHTLSALHHVAIVSVEPISASNKTIDQPTPFPGHPQKSSANQCLSGKLPLLDIPLFPGDDITLPLLIELRPRHRPVIGAAIDISSPTTTVHGYKIPLSDAPFPLTSQLLYLSGRTVPCGHGSDALQPPPKQRPHLQPSAIPMQPFFASMPLPRPQQGSPRKAHRLSPTATAYLEMGCVSIPPPQPTLFSTDSPTKKVIPTQNYHPPAPRPHQPLFATFNRNFDAFEQGNFYHPVPHENADFPQPPLVRKANLRRSYSDATPATVRPLEENYADDETETPLPEPEEMPAIEDDGNKPSYSYAQMIGMAILRAPNRRLTLAQIYDWISSTFAFYREDSKQGWHNSIRHNLSLNKAFQKMDRPKGDAGKGSYWVIQPGMEATFLKDKNRKAGASLAQIHVHTNMVRPDIQTASQPVPEPLAPAPLFSHALKFEQRPQTAPALPDLSSDATLPASDVVLDEGAGDGSRLPQPQSSPPDAINSSPPVAVAARRRSGSSPSHIRRTSAPKHKRNAATMDDSGYFSSIESSILRPNTKPTTILTSELDINRPRKKQRFGRAEDEIQRLRSSSHDLTPSRRSHSVTFSRDPQSSPPLNLTPPPRRDPATPAVFKKPMYPPPSVSPHTQLVRHRKAMQEFTNSPLKNFGLSPAPSNAPSLLEVWSPLKFPSAATTTTEEFEIFSDAAISVTPSPIKPTKRPLMTSASTTAKVLSNVLGTATARLNAKTPTRVPTSHPLLKPSPSIALNGSTPKRATATAVAATAAADGYVPGSIMADENHDDIFDWDQYNGNDESDENVDLTKGFEKIGAPAPLQQRSWE
ncbi:hypothetical protein DV736_g798, partial [Chaetothyriales sp. CBS 134916]